MAYLVELDSKVHQIRVQYETGRSRLETCHILDPFPLLCTIVKRLKCRVRQGTNKLSTVKMYDTELLKTSRSYSFDLGGLCDTRSKPLSDLGATHLSVIRLMSVVVTTADLSAPTEHPST